MRTVSVARTIRTSPERVFAFLADAPAYKRAMPIGILSARTEGGAHTVGVGTRRSFVFPGFAFTEVITAFEPLRRIEYRVQRSFPPIDHRRGEFLLTPGDGTTRVEWTSTFEAPVGRVLAPYAEAVAAAAFTVAFARALAAFDRYLTRDASRTDPLRRR